MMCERTENFQIFIFHDSIHMMGIIYDSKFSTNSGTFTNILLLYFSIMVPWIGLTLGLGQSFFFGNKYSVVWIMHVIELTNFK